MASNNSIWPTEPVNVNSSVQSLIHRFFEISNSTEPDSGKLFADELFTEDGFFKTHETCVFAGREAIAASRKNNSPLIVSRSYQLVKAFASDSPATDIVVLGNFTIGLTDGSITKFDFTARFQVAIREPLEGSSRFQSVQVWTDPTNMAAAFKKAAAGTAE